MSCDIRAEESAIETESTYVHVVDSLAPGHHTVSASDPIAIG